MMRMDYDFSSELIFGTSYRNHGSLGKKNFAFNSPLSTKIAGKPMNKGFATGGELF